MVALWKFPVPVPIIPLPGRESRDEGNEDGTWTNAVRSALIWPSVR